jgi:hypothetical protein
VGWWLWIPLDYVVTRRIGLQLGCDKNEIKPFKYSKREKTINTLYAGNLVANHIPTRIEQI